MNNICSLLGMVFCVALEVLLIELAFIAILMGGTMAYKVLAEMWSAL